MLTPIDQSFIPFLSGSEKVKVSLSKGKQLIETNNINKSLLTLGKSLHLIHSNSSNIIFRYMYLRIK